MNEAPLYVYKKGIGWVVCKPFDACVRMERDGSLFDVYLFKRKPILGERAFWVSHSEYLNPDTAVLYWNDGKVGWECDVNSQYLDFDNDQDYGDHLVTVEMVPL